MLTFPDFDPVAFSIGPLSIHWYGIMYIVGFGAAWHLGSLRARRGGWSPQQVSDLVFYCALGAVIGGRLGSVFFYNFDRFLADPVWLLRVWEGGMSYHGGRLGVLLASWLYGRRIGRDFFAVTDFVAPAVPLGLAAGRLGNFIGGELWGRPTELSWGMVFPHVDALPRHPSQLYQVALEGLALFVLVWWFSSRPRPKYAVSGMFLLGYGFFRFIVEFAREPDAHIGFIAFDWLTMGQLLCVPMLVFGLLLLWLSRSQPAPESVAR